MSRLALLLVLLAAGSNDAFAECTCPDGWGFSYEDTASSEGLKPFISLNDQIIGCGFVESQKKEWIIASEFIVFRCEADNKLKPLLFRGALTEAKFTKTGNSVVITEFERWPFGKNWKWIDVPTVRYSLGADTKNHQEVKSQIVIKPVDLSEQQITLVLNEYARFKKMDMHSVSLETVETVIGKLLVASLAGSGAAVKALEETTLLDAHYGETAADAMRTYNLYRDKQVKER